MEKIYAFAKQFLEKEAEVVSRKRIPDLEAYNRTLDEYNALMVLDLTGVTGHLRLTELRSLAQYKMFKNIPEDSPRKIFKITEYDTDKYGKAWVTFISVANARENFNRLDNAMIIIEEDSRLKVASFLSYSNYTEYGNPDEPYRWDVMWGYDDLSFETLKNPVKVERYLEPTDWEPGLKQYFANI